MHIIALSTNLFAIFNLFFVKKTLEYSYFFWNLWFFLNFLEFILWNNFYFGECLRRKMFFLEKVYVEKI